MKLFHRISYLFLDIISRVLAIIPFRFTQSIGKFIGLVCFYFLPRRRKLALSNLGMAYTLPTSSLEKHSIAKNNFITMGKVYTESLALYSKSPKALKRLFHFNPTAYTLSSKEPKIFFICHKGNWEGVFQLISLYNVCNVAVARPFKNKGLQKWITEKRSRFNAKVIDKAGAIRNILSELKNGNSVGVVADQAYNHKTSYSHSFFGTRVFSNPTPALLARKCQVPIIFMNTYFQNGKWHLEMHPSIHSNPLLTKESDLKQMMEKLSHLQEKTIAKHPHEWLWYHRRWKQGGYFHLPKSLRFDQILVILPSDKSDFNKVNSAFLGLIRQHYPLSFISVLCPQEHLKRLIIPNICVYSYEKKPQLKIENYAFQCVFNFTKFDELTKYYLGLGACNVFNEASFTQSPIFKSKAPHGQI